MFRRNSQEAQLTKTIWFIAHLQLTSMNCPIKVVRQRVIGWLFVNTGREWPDLALLLALRVSHRGVAQAACQNRALLGNSRLRDCVILNANLWMKFMIKCKISVWLSLSRRASVAQRSSTTWSAPWIFYHRKNGTELVAVTVDGQALEMRRQKDWIITTSRPSCLCVTFDQESSVRVKLTLTDG